MGKAGSHCEIDQKGFDYDFLFCFFHFLLIMFVPPPWSLFFFFLFFVCFSPPVVRSSPLSLLQPTAARGHLPHHGLGPGRHRLAFGVPRAAEEEKGRRGENNVKTVWVLLIFFVRFGNDFPKDAHCTAEASTS